MLYPTQTGPRKDLMDILLETQKDLGGWAWPKIFFILATSERAGTFSYAPPSLPNDTTGVVENRVNGTDLVGETVPDPDYNWTTGKLEARTLIYESQIKPLGGIEKADRHGAKRSFRRAMNKIEIKANATIFSTTRTAAATTLADQSVVGTLQAKALALRAYGKPHLYMSTEGLTKFLQIPEVRNNMFGQWGPQVAMSLLTGDQKILLEKLSPLIGFPSIVVYDSQIVGNANNDYIGIVALRDEAMAGGEEIIMTAKEMAMYAFAALYIPDGANQNMPMGISAGVDYKAKANLYDATGFYSLNEIHPDAVAVCKMLPISDYTTPGVVRTIAA